MEKGMIPFGHGLRACIGKNLAMHQLHQTIIAAVKSNLLEGPIVCENKIEMYEWFNGNTRSKCGMVLDDNIPYVCIAEPQTYKYPCIPTAVE